MYVEVELLGRSLCLMQVYTRNPSVLYPEFIEETRYTLRKVKTKESTVFLWETYVHVRNDVCVWKGMIRLYVDADVKDNGRLLLQLCCNNTLCIMNTFFQHRDYHK